MSDIRLESNERCPLCGSTGPRVIERAVDSFMGVPGEYSYRQCSACRTVWMDPTPTAESIPLLYPGKYYTHSAAVEAALTFNQRIRERLIARHYGYPLDPGDNAKVRFAAGLLGRSAYFRRQVGYHVRYCPYQPGGRLLDVGCGNGVLLASMQKRGWQVEGIEPDPLARQAAEAAGFRAAAGTAEDGPLEPQAYDAIVLTDVLEHTRQPKLAIERLYAALRPGGRLVCIYPNALSVYARRYGPHWEGLDPPRHLVFPSPESFARLLGPAGARVETFTITRYGRATIHLSANIRDKGPQARHAPRSGLGVKFTRSWLAIRELFDPDAGGELVCLAVKPK